MPLIRILDIEDVTSGELRCVVNRCEGASHRSDVRSARIPKKELSECVDGPPLAMTSATCAWPEGRSRAVASGVRNFSKW